ncbi:MAG: N-acetyltransferase [Saprospiraceae bacterium]|nr:N-acetyltransferase [Saprospiraceae bacterium]
MHIDPERLEIRVDTKDSRLHIPMKEASDAQLNYRFENSGKDTVIHFHDIFVPEILRNRGVGTRLVWEGMQYAQANGFKVSTSCDFVQKYLDRHPEFNSYLA